MMKLAACGLILAWAFAGVAAAQGTDPVPRPAKVFTAQPSETRVERRYPAIVFPSREVELSFRVSGRVIDLPVRGAMEVDEGDVIARLDPRDFQASIAGLESQRDQAQAQLRALKSGARAEEIVALEAAVAATRAQADQARDQLNRTRQLTERGVTSSAKLEQDEANLRVAEANLRAQEEQLAIGRAGGREEEIEAAEASLRGLESQLKTARDNLEDASLRAPFAGIVARRDIDNFANVQAGQRIILLQTLSRVDLAFDVPGPDVPVHAAARNIRAMAGFDSLPGRSFEAEFVEFSTQAEAATQTYRGRVAVDLPEGVMILPGMVGHVTVTSAELGAPVLPVPLTAIAADPGGAPFVWVVKPGANTVSRRKVELGETSGAMVAVTSGLEAGETVVSAGIGQLQDGMAIRPVTRIGG